VIYIQNVCRHEYGSSCECSTFFTRTGIFQQILVTLPTCHENPFSGSNAFLQFFNVNTHTKIYWLRWRNHFADLGIDLRIKLRKILQALVCKEPIAVTTWSKARNAFTHLNTGIVSSNPTQGMDVCVYSVFVLGSGLDPLSKESYRLS
jgi:hypothetical protein